jgi:hypothetical protein
VIINILARSAILRVRRAILTPDALKLTPRTRRRLRRYDSLRRTS